MSTSCRSSYLRSSPVNYSQSHRSTLPLCILYFPCLQNTFLFHINILASQDVAHATISISVNMHVSMNVIIARNVLLHPQYTAIVKDWIELVGLLLNWWVCHHSWQSEPGQDLTNVDLLARTIHKRESYNWGDECHSKFTFSTIFPPKKHLKHLC